MSPIAQPASTRQLRLPMRERLVEKAKARMAVPRVQMMLLLAATGGAGFLASYGLLQLGVDRMALRYPLAVGIAYLVFFLVLRLWLAFQRDPDDDSVDGLDLAVDVADIGLDVMSFGSSPPMPVAKPSGPSLDVGVPDLDEGIFLVVIAAVAAVVLGAVIYVIYLAPLLLAEVLVDGVLLVGFYKRLKRPQPEHWALCAVRRTWIPAIIVAVTFFFAGLLFQSLAPEARSIGGVWQSVSSDSQ
ncbi:MAG TPA: hypothetical protein VF179_18735 [Thermoanaerobaculia bacterium]|nr:hypothetical protein [Thermoanaerobaculia bacterium]